MYSLSWLLEIIRGHSCVLLDTIFFVYLLSSLFFICFVVSFLFLSRTKVCFKLTFDTSGCLETLARFTQIDQHRWDNLVYRVFSFSKMAMSLWFGYLFSYCFSVLGIPGDPAWIPGSLSEKIAEILGVGGGRAAGYDRLHWDGNSKGWEVLKCPTLLIWVFLWQLFFSLCVSRKTVSPQYFFENRESPWGQATMPKYGVK